jgi:hypothetical protein
MTDPACSGLTVPPSLIASGKPIGKKIGNISNLLETVSDLRKPCRNRRPRCERNVRNVSQAVETPLVHGIDAI